MITLILVLALVTLYLYLEWSPTDVDQSVLKHQVSAPPVRNPGESGVYRSLDTPHSTPLLREILGKHYEQFTLEMLWEPESFQISEYHANGELDDNFDFAMHVHKLGSALTKRKTTSVIVTLPAGIEALAMLFACGLYNICILYTEPEDLEEAKSAFPLHDLVVDAPLATDDELVERPIAKPSSISFYSKQRGLQKFLSPEVGLSIASQLRALGHRMWNRNDKVLIFPTCQHPYALLMQLTALSAKAPLVFLEHSISDPFRATEIVRPTVLVTDDIALESLRSQADEFNTIKLLQFQLHKVRLSRGTISSPMLPQFRSLRLIHTVNLGGRPMKTEDANVIRILTGSQVIHGFRTPKILMPIFQTAYGDYRECPKQYTLAGPPTPGIEIKVVGDAKKGRLFLKYDIDWIDTGVDVTMRPDGCAMV